MSRLPADLQKLLDDIDAADRAADALVASLTDEQLHWQPDDGRRWSIAQCLEHLATTNALYTDAIDAGLDAARRNGWSRHGPLAPGFLGRRFVDSMEPPVRRRLRSPGRTRPSSGLPREEILRRYREAHERVRQLVRDAATLDANRATFANPFFRWVRLKVATGLQVMPAHDRRHLWQAEQVRLTPGFQRIPLASGTP